MDGDKTLDTLKQINAMLTQINPLIGTAVGLGIMLVKSLKAQGTNIGPFEAEIAKFDALLATGFAVDAQWREEHGVPPI